MTEEPVSWFGQERIDTDAKALGVYLTALIVRFRVRYRTDVPMLRSDEFLFGARLKPILTLFLKDEDEAVREALTTGKEFLNALSKNTSFSDFEEALDDIERYFYGTFKAVYLRHVNRAAMKGTIADDDAPALIKTFLSDVSANRFSKGKVTRAGSCILLTPFGDLIEFYGLTQTDANRFLAILRESCIMFQDIVPAPVLEQEFIERLA
ncbi:MAG TPA: hypothetical protein VMW67_02215 [Desulfobacteria bacterium]|nr:hypothetical protein [Desulfobacteria bacterium]